MNIFSNQPVISLLVILLFIIIFLGLIYFSTPSSEKKPSDSTALTNQLNTTSRKPAVAGTFYPADKEILDTQLSSFLDKVSKQSTLNPLRLLIVPHAGIDYSGSTAAYGFKQIEGRDIKKVILLGSSHRHNFDHTAIDNSSYWETPLGKIEFDPDLAAQFITLGQEIRYDPQVHSTEHDLEVETIFLQKVLKDFKIIPVLISHPSDTLINALAYKISQNMDDQTLLVVSTDLSHYPDYETANKVDSITVNSILTGNKTQFENRIAEGSKANDPGVETLACGFESVRVALKVVELLKLDTPQLLKYQNSGDVTGDKSRVVGYASISVTGKEIKFNTPQLSEDAQKEALDIAKKSLSDFLTQKKEPSDLTVRNPVLNEPLGAFVTLRKKGELRGCIGEFEPVKPLYKVIQQKAIDAATKDLRFEPVNQEDLSDLTLEISVMTPKQPISDWKQIDLNKDGVVIVQGNNSGTFLPQVAKEFNWSLDEFMGQLCSQKAHLPKSCYLDPSTKIYTYQAQVFD